VVYVNRTSDDGALIGRDLPDLSANRLGRALRTARDLGFSGIHATIRRHGFRETAHFIGRNLRHIIAHRIALAWDQRHGVDTAGSIQLDGLTIKGPNRKFGNECVCTSPQSFEFMTQFLPNDLRDYTFVDFGAGKGRTLLLAGRNDFRKIIGVEFAGELVKCATGNIAHYKNAVQRCRNIQVIEVDAVEFVLPDGPLVIYFYNPFTREVFDSVMRNVVRSLKADRRDCYVVYGSSSADAIDWAGPAILATGCFTQVSTPPMPFFFDAVRTIRFGVFRLH
jgi:hypothetical protein